MGGISLSGEFWPPDPPAVKQYKVVHDQNRERFEAEVARLLNAGWHCQGGVSSTFNSSGIRIEFNQAMIRVAAEVNQETT